MPPLWKLDQEAFHSIHVGLHRDWLDPWMVAVTLTGVGYAQVCWLLLNYYRQQIKPAMVVGIVLGVSVAIGVIEKTPLAVAASVLGFALLWSLRARVAMCAATALVLAGVVRLVIAELVDRQRPSNFPAADALEHVLGGRSFPSGHTATTFAVAAVVCWSSPKTEATWIVSAVTVWSLLVGFSRVYVGVHYPLDVIGGAVVGLAVGTLVHRHWAKRGYLIGEEAGPSNEPS